MNGSRTVTSTTAKTLAVFIDADNLNDPTALDRVLTDLRSVADRVLIRKAYGRPESLKGIEAVLWRHGVRPVANLIVDKVTTDSALVIDAVEAVCTSDIDTVAICSGDADFVPLALWLREKGCKVLCYSLTRKIFANPESFYDDVILIDVIEAAPDAIQLSVIPPPSKNTVLKPVSMLATSPQTEKPSPTRKPASLATTAPKNSVTKPSVKAILAALPELRSNQPLHLSMATKKLRDAGLLGKSASSPSLFRHHTNQFELTPKGQPNSVKYCG
jgi:uncharacterized LabA/DUF88 family protein